MSEMYNIARTIEDPPDWELNRPKVMEAILRDKFRRHRDLRDKLKSTQTREIIHAVDTSEGENLFWGQMRGTNKG